MTAGPTSGSGFLGPQRAWEHGHCLRVLGWDERSGAGRQYSPWSLREWAELQTSASPGHTVQTPIVSPLLSLPRVVPHTPVLTALPLLSSAGACDPEMPDKAAQSEVSLAAALSFHKEGRTLQNRTATQNSTSQQPRGRPRALLVQGLP